MVTERRGFLAAVFGFFFTDRAAASPPPKLKGFLVFTVNVGQLPPYRAEAFLERLKDRMVKERQDPAWQIVMLPVRPPQETKFEVIVVEGDIDAGVIEAKRLKAFDLLQEQATEEQTQIIPPYEEVKDYILLMLGAPVVKVELDDQQVKLCFDQAVQEVMECPVVLSSSMVNRGALALAKMMLGRVRSKFVSPEYTSIMDGPTLLAEGERDLSNWREEIRTT